MDVSYQTEWAKVEKTKSRYADTNKPWQVMTRNYGQLYGSRSGWDGDFATKAEALAHVSDKGYVLVSSWKEANAQSHPLRQAQIAGSDRARAAREGLTLIRIGSVVRYVTPVDAGRLLTLFGPDPDEFGRMGEAAKR
jgi:hypothetical protein